MDINDYLERYDSMIKATVMAVDILLLNFLWWLFCDLADASICIVLLQSHILITTIYFSCTIKNGIILHQRKVRSYQIFAHVVRNVILLACLATPALYFGHFFMPSWDMYFLFLLALVLSITVARILIRYFLTSIRRGSHTKNGVIFVGSSSNNIEIYRELTDDFSFGNTIVGYFDNEKNDNFPDQCRYLGTPEDVIPFLESNNKRIRCLYCCLPSREKDTILPIINYCENNIVRFYSVPNLRNYLSHRVSFSLIGNVPCLSLHDEPLSWIGNRFLKRTFDIVFSLLFLCTLFVPILFVVTIITKLTMPGPVFFRQKRTGLNGKDFYCLKFRSMKVNADADILQATRDDPRKTRWGNFMRRTSIDELPQFINVLLGDMSVVGPRPHMLMHTEKYSNIIDRYMVRHYVKPGVTGLSQVNGFRGETKNITQMEERVKCDVWYIENWRFSLDLYIILRTVTNIFKGEENAY